MQVPETSSKFTPLQLELLKVFSFDVTEEELLEVRHMLASFFFDRLREQVDEAATSNGITDETLEAWLNEENQ